MAESKKEETEAKTDSSKIPNALQSFDSIIANENDNLLLFLDYDGTLSEIVANPDEAVLTKSMYELLIKLAAYKHITVIIVTGRSIAKVQSFIAKHSDIHFAGNHGIEIEFAQSKQTQHDKKLFVDEQSVKLLHEAYLELRDKYKVTQKYKGTQIEFKTYSLSLHYRNMTVSGDEEEQAAQDEMQKIMKDLSEKYKIHYSVGKKLFELKCVNDWNKGYAIKWMLQHRLDIFDKLKANPDASNNVIFIGDDVTDEDGFDALLNYGKDEKVNDNVSCILVTHNNKARQTKAGYHVNTVKDVEELLTRIGQKLN